MVTKLIVIRSPDGIFVRCPDHAACPDHQACHIIEPIALKLAMLRVKTMEETRREDLDCLCVRVRNL